MNKHLLTLLFVGATTCCFATNHLINISGFSFSPATVNAAVGDTVTWNVTGPHTATQVSQATWNANGNTPLSGGFDFTPANTSNGTSFIVCTSVGTVWYVCKPHASMGMKGQINVVATGLPDLVNNIAWSIYPNPVKDVLHLNSNASASTVDVEIINMLGKVVMQTTAVPYDKAASIDVSSLTKGVYFLKSSENKMRPVRFVKL
ncbi:MAG: T9SS type A sorting domain-containing protein [Bacteroidia bacterium]|nr:T9SS type A sorting domain-containing protein [Bacteroidia bacterium]